MQMLENLSRCLPAYEIYMGRIGRCHAGNKAIHQCLSEALGNVYADVVQFCYDLIRLFAPKKNGKSQLSSYLQNLNSVGLRYKASFVSRLLFRPFENQFSDVIERLDAHQRLLKLYMSVNTDVEAFEFHSKFERWWADGDSGKQAQHPNSPDAALAAQRLEGKTKSRLSIRSSPDTHDSFRNVSKRDA
jgi:hypothetical protein